MTVQGRPRLRKALADAYSPFFGRKLDPDTEITITTGANEGSMIHGVTVMLLYNYLLICYC
jgi:aspartate/methionine/tyrosine aminotransferase